MKNITLTPKGLISILLSFSLLCNMAAPAFAQVRVPSTHQIQEAVVQQMPTPLQDTIVPGFDPTKSFQELAKFIDKEMRGSLTDGQVARIKEIEQIFAPADPSQPVQSDFDFFEQTYHNRIDEEFERESNAIQASRREIQQKIDKNEQDYREEIYSFIAPKTAERVLNEQQAAPDILTTLLADIKTLSFDKDKPLAAQLNKLGNKYAPASPQADLFVQISQEVQQAADLREGAIQEWRTKAETKLQEWYTSNMQALNKWRQDAKQHTKEVFEKEYEPQILKEREQIVQESVQTLWNYKDLAPLASDTLLHIAPIIAPMSTLDGKSFFTAEQKDWLISHYLDTLRNNHECGERFPDNLPCDVALRAVGGLGLLTDSRDVAWEIEEFMEAKRDTDQSVPALLLGTASLLAMKQYSVLRGFLHRATEAEHNVDNIDFFSVETYVNMTANRNGHYLGEVSKYAQYPLHEKATDKTALGNAWEDMAQILADEGSEEALALLREFGVEKCGVYNYLKVNAKEETRFACSGIIPFLVGALASGKSGAENYDPQISNMQAGNTISANGSGYVTEEQARHNRALAQRNVQVFRQFAADRGLTLAGAIIYHLFIQSMGDLNAESELRLDTRLYEAFQAQNQTPKPEFTLTPYTRNSAEYNAKRLRQDRTQVFRKLGRLADIAILVWCLIDFTKWGISGVKIAGAFSRMARMARQGATVAQRAAYLRSLKIAPKAIKIARLPAKMKMSVSSVVLEQLPLFANQDSKLLSLPGAMKSIGTLTAENLVLSAETGNLMVNYQGLRAGGLTAKQAFDIQKTVEGATQTTNFAFANSSRFMLNKNAAYQRMFFANLEQGLNELSLANRTTLTKQLVSPLQMIKITDITAADGSNLLRPLSETDRFNIIKLRNMSAADRATAARLNNLSALERTSLFRPISAADRTAIISQAGSLSLAVPGNITAFKTPDLFHTLHGINIKGTAPQLNTTALSGLMTTALGRTPAKTELQNATKLVNSSLYNANIQFAQNPWWKRTNKGYKKIFMNNLTAAFDKDGQIFRSASYRNFYTSLLATVEKDRSLTAPSRISSWRALAQTHPNAQFVQLGKVLFVPAGAKDLAGAQELPLTLQADPKLRNIERGFYQRVTFTPALDKGNPFIELGIDGKRLPLAKIQLNQAEIPALFQAAAQANMPLRVKISAAQPFNWSTFRENYRLTRKLDKKRYFFRGRGELFTHEIPVSIRQADGSLQATQIILNADSHLGWRNTTAVLNGKNLSLYKDGKLLQITKPVFSLPKNQLTPFLDILRATKPEKPFSLTLVRGKNKITPLILANGLSLSSASVSLIVPLENTYGDQITEGQKVAISLALPYIPAALSPFISPFVMRYGALKVLKTSMVFSLAGLGFAGAAGFRGYASQQSPLPPLWPLFVSGAAIGISSSLSRSSLNLLIDGMGGGGKLLKSMLAKNAGSVFLLLPPVVYNFLDPKIDFSAAFPTMSALSLAMLTWISATRIDPTIGLKANFRLFKDFGLAKEGLSAMRLLFTKQVGPLVLATTAFTGFESAAFYKAGNQLLKPTVKKTGLVNAMPESNRQNTTALLTAMAIQLVPFLTRWKAEPLTRALKKPNVVGQEYRRILMMSYALNITGGSLLFANGLQGDTAPLGLLGLVMMGMGTANVTQSLQKLSNLRVLETSYVLRKTAGMTGLAKQLETQAMVTKTMTGFSSSQLGLAIVPLIVSHYTDNQIAQGVEIKSQAALDSMWIPLISIGLSAILAGPAIGILPKHIPQGIPFLAKGIFGSYPNAVKQITSPQFYLKKPLYGVPPGWLPLTTEPIINMQELIPPRRTMENAESQLKQQGKPAEEPLQIGPGK
ncbi:MAG: hypothetical protein IKP06_06490 [Elusimicrobiaceae bacterium]|nr:hypothetical protein [Elusimicrobiaceae bacterium]